MAYIRGRKAIRTCLLGFVWSWWRNASWHVLRRHRDKFAYAPHGKNKKLCSPLRGRARYPHLGQSDSQEIITSADRLKDLPNKTDGNMCEIKMAVGPRNPTIVRACGFRPREHLDARWGYSLFIRESAANAQILPGHTVVTQGRDRDEGAKRVAGSKGTEVGRWTKGLLSNVTYSCRIIRWMKWEKKCKTYTVNLDALPDLAKCESHSTLQRTHHMVLGNRRPNVHREMFQPFALLAVVGRGGSRKPKCRKYQEVSGTLTPEEMRDSKESTPIETKNNIIGQALGNNRVFKHKGQRTRNPGRDGDEESFRAHSGNAPAYGSMHALKTLFDGIPNTAPEHLPFLLPVFHSSLDPVEILTILERVDLSAMQTESVRLRVAQALIGLRGIVALGALRVIPSPAPVDLWPNTWQWIEFLDTYHDNLPNADVLSSTDTIFRENEQASSLIGAAVSVCVVVGRAWPDLVHADNKKAFGSLCGFFGCSLNILDHNKFDEFVAGAGNTRTDFASLVVSHIERVVPHSGTIVTEANLFQLLGIMYLVEGVFLGTFDVVFRHVLLSQGIVTALTTASQAISCSTEPEAKITLRWSSGH
ncbi:hypothetical protein B0H13DRAFT_2495732 [Mycena leptocephala]|nr:hypothetical protein B0H13DRAFT_2495732 [Mycena leptocephala]